MNGKFDEDKQLGEELHKWWMELQSNQGDRAELRRAKSIEDVILLPVFHRTSQRFRYFFEGQKNWEYRFAAVIGLVAHVRTTTKQKLAEQMAGNPKPTVSELRFRRLLQRDRKELYVALIRVLRMLGNHSNLYDLANSMYYWGDIVKKDWAFTYFPNTPNKVSN